MGFWVFMTVMVMLFPAIMIIFGKIFMSSPPKDINFAYGYRTSMSMKNKDTWIFAHKFFGKIWLIVGIVLIPFNLVPMLLCLRKAENVIGNVGYVLCVIDLLAIIIPIIFTEFALKKNFDKDGNKKQNG